MKRVFLHREGAYGDHVHMSNVIRAFHQDGWEVTMSYNHKGAQIHSFNPMITHHEYFESGAKDATQEMRLNHLRRLERAIIDYDQFITFQHSLEVILLPGENQIEYFWPLRIRRNKTADICFYDWSMKWAGLTDEKYMGWSGDVFFTKPENDFVINWLKPIKDNYLILWALRGSMYQKAMYPIAEQICTEFIRRHPETIIITTGDKFCQQWEWEHEKVIHRSGRMPFRQALCMAQFVDMVVTPETGLGIGAGSFSTPKIMMLTAASLKNVVGNDKNDYSLQSPAFCSPCFRAIYNTRNCPLGTKDIKLKGKYIDAACSDYGKEEVMPLPICVEFPPDMVLDQMERIYQEHGKRDIPEPKVKYTVKDQEVCECLN